MRKNRFAFFVLLLSTVMAAACSPWIKSEPGVPVYTFLDIPMDEIYAEPEKHMGMVFEDQFKFYRIYHDKETADPSKREQTIRGKTHFTARPIPQYLYVIRIRITPQQEKWINKKGIRRQDAIKARVRFAGIAPNGNAAFDLLEILE
jgi:hypothetical protein